LVSNFTTIRYTSGSSRSADPMLVAAAGAVSRRGEELTGGMVRAPLAAFAPFCGHRGHLGPDGRGESTTSSIS
jgi:hypothetical protein